MKLLIIRSDISNPNEYSVPLINKIRKVFKSVHPKQPLIIKVVNPIKEKVDRLIGDVEIIICAKKNFKEVINFIKADKLKWIHVTSAGVTDLIPLFKNTHIILTNASGISAVAIAEQTIGYLLTITRQYNKLYLNQCKHDWQPLTPQELYGKKIGIIGFGRVGKQIAKLALAFNMNVYVTLFRKKIKNTTVTIKKNIHSILKESDFVVNCLPLTSKTKGIFSLKEFKHMKKTSYFINVGVGNTVIEKDLIKALKKRLITGACLDVFQTEPLPKTSELWGLDNVIITPHTAGRTPRYTERGIDIFCENFKKYLVNKTLPNKVNLLLEY